MSSFIQEIACCVFYAKPPLLTWVNFNPRMDHTHGEVWDAIIFKIQWLHQWSLKMEEWFHPTPYNECNNLSMVGSKFIHVSKRGSRTNVNLLSIRLTRHFVVNSNASRLCCHLDLFNKTWTQIIFFMENEFWQRGKLITQPLSEKIPWQISPNHYHSDTQL